LSPSRPFILRPVATSLLMAAIMLVGIVSYIQLPVSALPQVDYPTIQILTFYPGASPDVVATTVTAPLERQFGQLQGLSQMTSSSSGGTSVIVGGLEAPLYFVSPGQVNAQIPFELTPGQPYQVIVSNNGALTTPETIQSTAVTPGVASLPSGYANAQHAAESSPITDASPAKPGEFIVIYLAGMGVTTVPVASGAGSPSSPLAQTVEAPTITLDSEPVSVLFSGLTPALAGLYQIDLQVPADAQNGDLTLVVNQPGYQGGSVILPVHN